MPKINQLESLKVLKAVVEAGSFTAAAKRLSLTVARVSKSIEHLELELNSKLFLRSTRHMQLTDSGERSYSHAIKLLEQWRELTDELTESQSKPKGKLKISVPMSWGLCVFSTVLAKFMAKYPQISIDVHMSDQQVNVIEGEYDLVLRLTNKLEDSSLLCKRLKTYKFIACASPEYLEIYGIPLAPQALKSHACLLYSQLGSRQKWQFSKNKKETSVYIEPRLQSNNSTLFREALLAHQGIALIPEFIVSSDIASGRLIPVLTDYTNQALNLYSLRPVDHMIPMRLKMLNEFLYNELI
ncbi:MAG: DNA-binding transcriptional LysR family regulator [Alteromonadaceae bacterium]|jgi:DNA-binding transcriptional LysR family regulator